MLEKLQEQYGYLFEDSLIQEIAEVCHYLEVPEGSKLMKIGDYIKSMPLIINGAIKVLREDEKGGELVLYYIEPGDTCAMTLSCCLGDSKSEIIAITETDTQLVMIPIQKMEEWLSKYKSWQRFILQSYHNRMSELLESIDSIAFMNLDERLFKYLKDKAMVNHNDIIHVTHEEIAQDLHTSRVVISRVLKKLALENKISLHRHNIKVFDL